MRAILAIMLLALGGWWSLPWLKTHLPPQWNPFTPLQVTDPPGWLTRYKLQRLSAQPQACLAVMRQAREQGRVQFRELPPLRGDCAIDQPLRITGFGAVSLSSSFLASCPMAVASTLYVTRSDAVLQQAGHGGCLGCDGFSAGEWPLAGSGKKLAAAGAIRRCAACPVAERLCHLWQCAGAGL